MRKTLLLMAATGAAFFISGCATGPKFSEAVETNNVDAIVAMVENGMDPMAPTESGKTPFEVVYEHAYSSTDSDRAANESMPLFAKNIATRSERWISSVCSDIRNRDMSVEDFEEALLSRGPDVSLAVRGSRMTMNNHVPLEHCLAAANKTQYLDVLLSNGGNPNAVGKESRTALDIATFYGLANVVEMLLASGADPNKTITDESNILAFFVGSQQYGNRVNDRGILRMVLAAGMDPNARIDGVTPLEHAILTNRTEVANHLLAAGANPDRALHVAAYYGRTDWIVQLLAEEASTDANEEFQGETPLHTAINGLADDKYDELTVPLMIAEESSHASLNTADNSGYTVLGMAQMEENRLLIEMLKDVGATAENEPTDISEQSD